MSFKVLVMGGVKTNLEHWFCPRAIILILRLSKLSFAGIRVIIMKYINFGIFYFKCIIFINFFLQKGRLTILIYKMLVSVCVCVSVFPCLHSLCWFLSPVKSVWGVWGIIGTSLARACCILSFTQFHARLHAIHAISPNFCYFIQPFFSPLSTCWV